MEEIKEILEQYEMIIINLSKDNKLEDNLKKYENGKRLLTKKVLERMVNVPNYQTNFIKMLNHLFEFDDEIVFDTFKYI
jgi:nicotinamide mononucleotide adenylyltransferase